MEGKAKNSSRMHKRHFTVLEMIIRMVLFPIYHVGDRAVKDPPCDKNLKVVAQFRQFYVFQDR